MLQVRLKPGVGGYRLLCGYPVCREQFGYWTGLHHRGFARHIYLGPRYVERELGDWRPGTHAKQSRHQAPRRPRRTIVPHDCADRAERDHEGHLCLRTTMCFFAGPDAPRHTGFTIRLEALCSPERTQDGKPLSASQEVYLVRPERIRVTCMRCGAVSVIDLRDLCRQWEALHSPERRHR